MRKRGITVQDVANVVSNHWVELPGTHPGGGTVVLVGGSLQGHPLAVVVEIRDPSLVVTAFWAQR